MPTPPQTREPHRSFTIRLPISLYEQVGQLALEEDVFVTTKINQLIRLGLGEHVNLNQTLAQLLKKETIDE